MRRLAAYAVCAAIVGAGLLAQGCEQGGTRPATVGSFGRVLLDTRLDMQVAAAIARRAAVTANGKHALAVPDPVRVSVTVEAPDIGQLRAEVTLPASSIEVLVPRGTGRTITLRYLDGSQRVLGFGQVVADLTQDVQTVAISIVSALPGITIGTTFAPIAVVRGATATVTSQVVNNSTLTLRVDQAGHRFRTVPALADQTPGFADVSVSPAVPFTVSPGATVTYSHTSTVGLSVPLGLYQVDGIILGARGTDTYGLRVSTMPGQLRVVADRELLEFAGDGSAASTGNGGQAAMAGVKAPTGVAFASTGEIFISTDQTLRRVATDGVITQLAGVPGTPGTGDGPPGVPRYNDPKGVSVRADGTVLMADRNNNRIVVVNATGNTSTTAGGGGGFADNVPATSTTCNLPEDVLAIGTGSDFFYADTANHIVRRVTGGTVRTFAGVLLVSGNADGSTATATLEEPRTMAFDLAGNLLIGCGAANGAPERGLLRRVDAGGSTVTTVAGNRDPAAAIQDGVSATVSALEEIQGVAVDAAGNIYIATRGATVDSGRVRLVTPEGVITTVAGGGAVQGFGRPATAFALDAPARIAKDPGRDEFLIALFGENRVKRLR